MHDLNDVQTGHVKSLPKLADTPRLSVNELKLMIKQHRSALSPQRLESLSAELGVGIDSLKRLRVGYDVETGFFSFPMVGADEVPIGIRLRVPDGQVKNGRRYLCVPGSRNGLFIPEGYEVEPVPEELAENAYPLLLLMPEGPTDVAAALDMGFRAIGRPSNIGGADLIHKLLARSPKQDVVIVADRDSTKYLQDGTPFWPGWEGALSLAKQIQPSCGTLRIIKPPHKTKDLRQWMKDGGRAEMIDSLIGRADHVTARWMAVEFEKLKAWKVKLKRKAA